MENKKARILIEDLGESTQVELNGNGAEIMRLLSLAIYDIHKDTNIPIKAIIENLYSGVVAHKVIENDGDEVEALFNMLNGLLEK